MPELPEVETIARTLEPLVSRRCITDVAVLRPSSVQDGSLPLESLKERRIVGVGRRGKLVLIRLDGEAADPQRPHLLAVHLKMTGRLLVRPADAPPETHTRVILHMAGPAGREQLCFDDVRAFGYLRLLSPHALVSWEFWNKLGPEPLELSPVAFRDLLWRRRGRIKALLLDQTVLAGIGNIYADESLFRAGIAPQTSAERLDARQLERLGRQIQAVLRQSIKECGSSIRDYRTANGDAGAFQNSFRVYGRGGQPCRSCGRPLSVAKVAGRTSVFCEHCQK